MAQCSKCLDYEFSPPLEAWDQDPDGLCLLHSPKQEKDSDGAFSSLIKKKKGQKDYYFVGVFFPKDVRFEYFIDNANFRSAQFTGNVDFNGAIFRGEANFQEANFNKESDFSSVRFDGGANFLKANFTGKANFEETSFAKETGEANFYKSTFSEEVRFSDVYFWKEASFYLATFDGEALFWETIFKNRITFSMADFGKGAIFSRTTFDDEVDFSYAGFTGKANVTFRYINPPSKIQNPNPPYKLFKANFTNMGQDEDVRISFQECSLALARFAGTDISRINFEQVEWFRNRKRGRNMVYDEIGLRGRKTYVAILKEKVVLLTDQLMQLKIKKTDRQNKIRDLYKSKPPYERVETVYRLLKSNYEEKKDFKRVGDFHYGEMEMRRLADPWSRWWPFTWRNMYWALNGYGERPNRAFIWFVILFLFFSFWIYHLGLYLNDSNTTCSKWDSFLFILEKATLQRPQWAKPSNEARLMAGLSGWLLPGQLAMLFLALRNYLGRRR